MSRKKITAKTANDGWVAPKVRKKRKPMTPEQREAAVERLAKARAARAPAKNESICQSVIDKGDEHPLSAKKIKEWIKTQKDLSNDIGISLQILSRWESGKEFPTNLQIAKIKKYLKVKLPRGKKILINSD